MKILNDPEQLNLNEYIPNGAHIHWGHGSGEAVTLARKLIEQRHEIGEFHAFMGMNLSGTLQPEHCDVIHPYSFGALASNFRLQKSGLLELHPCNYSSIPNLVRSGQFPIDVVLLQLSPKGPDGTYSFGYSIDVLPDCLARAKVVIAEINAQVPWTRNSVQVDEQQIDVAIEVDVPVPDLPSKGSSDTELQIARNVVELIPNGAAIEYGIGTLPGAILSQLSDHQELGIHTGIITEDLIDLYEAGVITDSRKKVFAGKGTGAFCIGGERLRKFLDQNDVIELHPVSVTHSPVNMGLLDDFVAINSALEVDLFGQVNAEQIGDHYMGAIGGQVDFMHAATTNETGLSIIVLPSKSSKGASRIVSRLNGPFVTTARADVEMVVTEYGVADLRGKSLGERARALISVAAPEFRDRLQHDFRKLDA